MSEQPTPTGVCGRCGGTGNLPHSAVVARGDRGYECVRWTIPCFGCQPLPDARDAWLAAAQLGWPKR
jgi:hypothetical protein